MYVPGTDLDGLRADLGSVPLGGVDEAGVAWILQSMEGWDSSDSRSEVQQREADHGAWFTPVYLSERPVTLGGLILAPDPAALEAAMERARAAAALTDTLLVVHESVPKQSVVRRSGRPVLQYVTDTTASYSLMVTAADPRRYSVTEQAGSTGLPMTSGGLAPPITPPVTVAATTVAGQVVAANQGTVGTRPVLRIDGPVTDPTVFAQYPDGTVKRLAYSESIADGEYLTIDVDAKSVILNGTASRRRYLSAQWPEIPADATVTFLFAATGYNSTALLTVTWRSAWL
ncbi:phage tail family protein [Streptomyces sp. GMY02]|uniref:phage tail family protein n=1 Tax=Streptomyces sp. GMY02 TaxID=1333528 RepID=UPI001C2BE0B9|nr:phage tail family protein [Streptomyces sp. GMY02]QXE36214.1 phage tail family protein [Streptomyces sp. GMY02]